MALAWSHAVLLVRDEARMRDFYSRVLGFQVTDRGPIPDNQEIIFMSQVPDEHHQIAMVPGRADSGPSNSHLHLAFRVSGLPELRGVIRRLQAETLTLRPITHGNTWSIYFDDPEQNGIEIFCDTPWQVRQPAFEGWDIELDDTALLAWTYEKFRSTEGFLSQDAFRSKREDELAAASAGG